MLTLRQMLGPREWAGILIVAAANAIAMWAQRRPGPDHIPC
jgi:hypothetical protein